MSSKVKKIISIVIISLVLAITITTVVLAIVPKKFYNPIVEGYDYVTVYKKDQTNLRSFYTKDESDKETLDNIQTYLEKSVKDNILSTIFQGTASFDNKIIVETTSNVISNVASGKACLVFGYVDAQTLMFNGAVYNNPDSKKETITFNKLVMPISDDEDFQERTIYVMDESTTSNYKIKFLAHQSDLYDYIESIDFDF